MLTLTGMRCGAACAALLLGLALPACEHRVVESTKTTEGPNGSTVEKKTTVQHDDGTVTEEKEKRTTENP